MPILPLRSAGIAPGARGHEDRVCDYTRLLARELARNGTNGLTFGDAERLAEASRLHDIGKSALSVELLERRLPLTDLERAELRRHVGEGLRLLRGLRMLDDDESLRALAAEVIESHHERWDGGGYPRGLVGEEIPLSGRIVALADVYDALRSERAYKPAYSHAVSLTLICRGRGTQFDPRVVDAFLRVEASFDAVDRVVPARRRAA
jgi:putative two-component system response regulator